MQQEPHKKFKSLYLKLVILPYRVAVEVALCYYTFIIWFLQRRDGMKNRIGLYIHIPFCRSKCPYCDFYSMRADSNAMEEYTDALIRRIPTLSSNYAAQFDTVYIGGGTPSAIGADRLCAILGAAAPFTDSGCEITVECNPFDGAKKALDFSALKAAGVNRISMGMQSANDSERRSLGRLSGREDVAIAVKRAQSAGIDNISLDLMLAVPNQTADSLKDSIHFCADLGVRHVSSYILKIEEGTQFYKKQDSLPLPDEDETCELYLTACEELEKCGFMQYEISNFAVPDYESRHNLKYWNCEEYLGIGPAAHSFVGGKRFCFERDIRSFIGGCMPTPDGDGGSFEEYVMLRLRLCDGLVFKDAEKRFGKGVCDSVIKKAEPLVPLGLVSLGSENLRLTKQGFLLSNSVIAAVI